jgi:RNA polymerase sigma factor (sigma-70 family)
MIEVTELKKSIDKYILKFPASDRKTNLCWLKRLSELRPFISNNEEKYKEYHKIRESIVLSNGGFAMKYVLRYLTIINDQTVIGELFQEANIGLIETIDAFDTRKDTSFTTYAYYHIRKRIIDFIKKNKIVKAPRDIARNIKHVSEVQNQLLTETGNEPTSIEVTTALKKRKGLIIKESIVDNIMILLELNNANHDNAFIIEYNDQLTVEDETDLFRDMELVLLKLISEFPANTQQAIKLRYGIGRECPHSPEEVRLMLNLSKKDMKKFHG